MRILFDHGYWALRLIEDLRADAPEQRCMKCIESAAADDDQVTMPLFGKVEDRLRRTASGISRFAPSRIFSASGPMGPATHSGSHDTSSASVLLSKYDTCRMSTEAPVASARMAAKRTAWSEAPDPSTGTDRNQDTSQPFHTMNPSRSISLSWCIIREHMGKFL